MLRTPSAAVVFGDVALPSYMRQGDRPLAGTRGHLYDHIALGVGDLDAWVAKLRGEEQPPGKFQPGQQGFFSRLRDAFNGR